MANKHYEQRPGMTDPYGADKTSNPTAIKWEPRPKIDPMDEDKTRPKGK